MKVIAPTQKGFVLDAEERTTVSAAGDVVQSIIDNVSSSGIDYYSGSWGNNELNRYELEDIVDFLKGLAAATSITEH